jgi:hypothetical protein
VDNLEHLLVTMASIELHRTDTERTVALLGAAEAMRRQAEATVPAAARIPGAGRAATISLNSKEEACGYGHL